MLKSFVYFFLAIFLSGCSEKLTHINDYKFDGIKISYESHKNTNKFNGKSHPLLLMVYQYEKLNDFKRLIQSQEGIDKLLKGDNMENSFISFDRFVVIPNEKKTIIIDKLDNAKYICVVAGFYNYNNTNDIAIFFGLPTKKKFIYFGEDYFQELNIILKIKENSIYGGVVQ